MGMMSVIRALSQSTLENGHAPPRHEGLRWPSSVLVICDPISSLRAFHIWLSLLWFLRSSSNWQHPQESLFRHVSLGAAGWPCLLQAFACWVPSAGPFSCIWRRAWFCSHFIPPKPIQRPFAPSVAFSADAPCFGQLMPWISLQNAVLLPKGRVLPLGPASLGPLVSGAAGRPCLLLAFTCWVPSADPFSCTWSSVQFYLQCFSCCWQLPVYRKVWSPWRPPFWPTLSTARCQLENEQCCWPSIGPLVSGAAGRPCLLQALPCWAPLSTAFGDVYSSTHRASGATSNCTFAEKSGFPWRPSFWPILSTAKCQQDNVPMRLLVVAVQWSLRRGYRLLAVF